MSMKLIEKKLNFLDAKQSMIKTTFGHKPKGNDFVFSSLKSQWNDLKSHYQIYGMDTLKPCTH